MKRKLLITASALSSVLCLAMVGMWVRSYRVHDRAGLSTPEGRYTFHSNRGRLALTGPPAGQTTAAAAQMAMRISNDDLDWTVRVSAQTRAPNVEGWFYHVRPQWKPGSGGERMSRTLGWRNGMGLGGRPLLEALEDPQRAVAAHVMLLYFRQKEFRNTFQGNGDHVIVYYDEAVPVSINKSDLRAAADASAWRNLRDVWHERLDVQVFAMSYAWPVSATALPATFWLLWLWRRRRAARAGCCRNCGYNLTGNTSGVCPECGMPVAGRAGARA